MPTDAKTALVPKLRFPEFRGAEEWPLTAGDAVFDQINDKNPEPGLPVLAITQEHGAIPRHLIDYHVSVSDKSIESYKVVRIGDFVISLRSFQGGIEYSGYDGICSPAYVILRRRGKGSDDYFRHYLKTAKFIRILTKNIEGLRDGKMISYAQFSDVMLPVPKLPEQIRIAECLSSADEAIAAQARKVDALKKHKKGLMQQLFPREGETQPHRRFPEFQNAGEWRRERLQEVTDSVFDGTHQTPAYTAEGVPFYSVENLISGNVNKFISRSDYILATKKNKPTKGDILLTRIGKIGYSRVVTWDHDFSVYVTLAVIKQSKLFNSHYMSCFIQSEFYQSELRRKSLPDAVPPKINLDNLRSTTVLLPNGDEQRKLADCFTALDHLIIAETQKAEALKRHKRGLMQQLFPLVEEAKG